MNTDEPSDKRRDKAPFDSGSTNKEGTSHLLRPMWYQLCVGRSRTKTEQVTLIDSSDGTGSVTGQSVVSSQAGSRPCRLQFPGSARLTPAPGAGKV